jgi:hypothetical protein
MLMMSGGAKLVRSASGKCMPGSSTLSLGNTTNEALPLVIHYLQWSLKLTVNLGIGVRKTTSSDQTESGLGLCISAAFLTWTSTSRASSLHS